MQIASDDVQTDRALQHVFNKAISVRRPPLAAGDASRRVVVFVKTYRTHADTYIGKCV